MSSSAGRRLRILLTEDSPLMAEVLTELLQADGDIEVVGVAGDGRQAVRANRTLEPDLVVLDLQLPVMDGLTALDHMLVERPVPVLVVTGTSRGKRASVALDALRRGALDLLVKPEAWSDLAAKQLRTRVRTLARVRVRRRGSVEATPIAPARVGRWRGPPVLGIGCSTGGPPALAEVLGALPADWPVPVLVVQHIQAGFDVTLASWLNDAVDLPVGLAEGGVPLRPGAWLAPVGHHLRVDGSGRTTVTEGPAVDGHRPSATVLFRSLAEHVGDAAMGVVLTGMGSDGANGLLALREAGGHTVAESESTAVVYGMPRAAVEVGAARRVLALPRIGADALAWGRRR